MTRQKSIRSLRRLTRKRANFAAAPLLLCLLTAPLAPSASSNLPEMGQFSQISMDPQTEYKLGQKILASLRQQLPLIEDSITTHYLNNLGSRLVAATENSRFPFTFLIINAPSINAFAAPGGIIVIHSGLLEAAENESELAAVLAHEIAHVTQRHIARFYDQSGSANIAALVGIVAAVLLAAYSPAAAQASLMTGMAAGASHQLKFSRENEKEADRHGREILKNAGFDPQAMGRFFKKLQQASLSDPTKVSEFLQTHPLPESRVSDVWFPQAALPVGEMDSDLFPYIQARVKALTHQGKGAKPLTTHKKAAAQYAQALRYLQLKQTQMSRKVLDAIDETSPQPLLLINLLRAETYLVEHQAQKAKVLLQQLLHKHSHHPTVLQLLATAYLENSEPQRAYAFLRTLNIRSEAWLPLLKLKADAASQSGNFLASHETLSHWYEKRGQYTLALEQTLIAKTALNASPVSKARLETREQWLRDKLRKK